MPIHFYIHICLIPIYTDIYLYTYIYIYTYLINIYIYIYLCIYIYICVPLTRLTSAFSSLYGGVAFQVCVFWLFSPNHYPKRGCARGSFFGCFGRGGGGKEQVGHKHTHHQTHTHKHTTKHTPPPPPQHPPPRIRIAVFRRGAKFKQNDFAFKVFLPR